MTPPGHAGGPSPAPARPPRGRRGTARHRAGPPGILIAAGTAVSIVAFAFCVIASVAYGWHRAVTRPGIAVSVIAMVACAAAAHLLGDGGDDGEES